MEQAEWDALSEREKQMVARRAGLSPLDACQRTWAQLRDDEKFYLRQQ